jgi:ATP adenylyltransferase
LGNENLWAPWRIKYVQGLDKEHECFICHHIEDGEHDDENLVLWRTDKSIVILNRYPYNNGHLLIAPKRHVGGLEDISDDEILELNKLIRESQRALGDAIKPHGFNVGMNFGRCAGAGLPGHMHIHVVPRWDGDTNFMSVCGDTKIISQSLSELLSQLREISERQGYPCL